MKKRFVVSLVFYLSAVAIVSCSSRHVAEKPDITIPTILSISPVADATAVAITTAVTCTFSEAMNKSTINAASFLLESVTSTATTTIAGTVTYDASSNVATFTPSTALEHSTVYTATITTLVTDAAGNAIAPSFSWSFTTIPAPGALDTSFGSGGRVGQSLGFAMEAAIQQDGKIVAAVYSTLSTLITPTMTTYNYFTITRFQSNGALDTTFGFQQNGRADYFSGTAMSVGLQPDGKIVAAGDNIPTIVSTSTSTPVILSDFLVARYNADGTLDSSFGPQSNGTVTTDMGYDRASVNSLAIQTDGNIVVAGVGRNTGSSQSVSLVARFTKDGSLDGSFNSSGNIEPTPSITSSAVVVKIQPTNGMIVVGGNIQNVSGPKSIYLSRYDSNGVPDPLFSFGTVTASPGTDPVLSDIAILSNGKIIVAGTTNGSTNADVFLMRYNTDGTLDTTFGSSGTVITDDLIHGSEEAAGLAIQADGKIIISATFHPTSGAILTNDFALLRYDAEGKLDMTFGNGYGMVTTDLSNGNVDFAFDVQIQQDGKIVVVGAASNAIGMARYWP